MGSVPIIGAKAMRRLHSIQALILAVLALASGGSAESADTGMGLRTGVSYSTNIRRTPADSVAESIALVGFDARLARVGTRSEYELIADLAYLSYLGQVFEDEVLGRADGNASFSIVSDRVKWVSAFSYGQIQVDPRLAINPENREDVRFLATGPDIRLQLGRSAFALLTARFSDASYEVSELDGNRLSTSAEIGRELSNGNKVSLNATRDSLTFAQSVQFPDYDRTNYFVAYEGKAKRTIIQIAAGYVTTNTPQDQQSSPLLRVGLSRDLTASTSMFVNAGTRLTDVTDSFSRIAPVGAPIAITQAASPGSPATFRRDEIEALWRYRRARNEFTATAYWYEDTFNQNSNFDVERWEFRAAYRRKLSPVIDAQLNALVDEATYRNVPVIDRGWLISAQLDYQVGRRLSLIGVIAIENRDAGIVFSDQRASIAVRYAPFR